MERTDPINYTNNNAVTYFYSIIVSLIFSATIFGLQPLPFLRLRVVEGSTSARRNAGSTRGGFLLAAGHADNEYCEKEKQ